MRGDYLFSVIIPICGNPDFLSDTLESVVGQDIGFEKHIQMIIVDGGDSEEGSRVCRDFEKRYPHNVVCVRTDGGDVGINAARNEGIRYAAGKYVTFPYSGDRFGSGSFQAVYECYETASDMVDVVFCCGRPGSGIVDIQKQYREIRSSLAGCFIRGEKVRKHIFQGNTVADAESLFVNSIILEGRQYGVAAAEESFVGGTQERPGGRAGQKMPKEWYLETPRMYYMELIRQSVRQYEEVLPYIQFLICSDFQWRLRDVPSNVLDEKEQKEYEACLREMLSYMDDAMICRPEKMYVEYKLFALSLKYGRDITGELVHRKGRLYFGTVRIYSLEAKSLYSIDVLAVKEGSLLLSGRIWCPFADRLTIYFENDRGERFPVEQIPAGFRKAVIFGKEMIRVRGYEAELPLSGVRTYHVCAGYEDRPPHRLHIRFGKFSHLSVDVSELYYEDGGYMVGREGESGLWVREKTRRLHFKKELKLLQKCMRDRKYEIIGYRTLYHIIKPFLRRERWVIMERIHVAGDNAEYFYKYVKQCADKDVKSCFSISKDSGDFARMREIGKVLPFRGFRYKLNILLADKIISSQGEDHIFNPWDSDSSYIRDLYKYKFVFLQHGIIKDDLSAWLNKFNKNLSMFVTSAKPEYESILNGDYFYDKSVVKLTGLPRYDTLKQNINSEKSILFMPTWRFALTGKLNDDTGEREYNARFKHSAFFQFYQQLIQDERLLRVLRDRGYKGRFILHTNHKAQIGDFAGNDTIRVVSGHVDYQREFRQNALLVTDFSSVAFDFAYLKKPVIYAQFDRDTFFEGQIYDEGYFDYERDGFGPVCYDYETTLRTLIRMVQKDCCLDHRYDERSNEFYRWFDQDNCRRVYEAVRSLEG